MKTSTSRSTSPSYPVATRGLSVNACRAVLERNCVGHLSFLRQSHVDTMPIRFAFVDGWLYFRADREMVHTIGHNAWVVVSAAETFDTTHVASVVARGACYATDHTGSAEGDAAALLGIRRLRERLPMTAARRRWEERVSTVFRIHVDELRGRTILVPCPPQTSDSTAAGSRAPRRSVSPAHSVADQARADEARADQAHMERTRGGP